MSTIQPIEAGEDFLAGVEHGRMVSAMDVIALRLNLEGETRKRVRRAVEAERRRGNLQRRRAILWTAILVGLAVYNATLHGVGWPW